MPPKSHDCTGDPHLMKVLNILFLSSSTQDTVIKILTLSHIMNLYEPFMHIFAVKRGPRKLENMMNNVGIHVHDHFCEYIHVQLIYGIWKRNCEMFTL